MVKITLKKVFDKIKEQLLKECLEIKRKAQEEAEKIKLSQNQ